MGGAGEVQVSGGGDTVVASAPPFEVICVGSCMTDLITTVPRLPQLGETLVGTGFASGFGGKGANQAVTAARLGGRVAMVACVGDDRFGHATLDNFEAQGVDARHVRVLPRVASGVAPITVLPDGHNTVLIVPGANERLEPEAALGALDDLGRPAVILCQLEIPDETVLASFHWAREHGVRTILNPAPARPVSDELLDLADVIAPNETELMILTGVTSTDDLTDVARGARTLRRRSDQAVIVTLGARGVWLCDDSSEHSITTPAVQAVDSTGAGDAFVGTLALLLARGVAVAEAAEFACRVATVSVQRAGTQTSFPDAMELRALGMVLPKTQNHRT